MTRMGAGAGMLGLAVAAATLMPHEARARDVLLTAAIGDEVVQLVAEAPKVTQVVVNERVVYEDRESASLSFVNAYNMQGRWLVLIQQNAESGCKARYRVLDLSGPKPAVTLPFGSCRTAEQVAMSGPMLTVSMPGADGKGSSAWTYQDGLLTRVR